MASGSPVQIMRLAGTEPLSQSTSSELTREDFRTVCSEVGIIDCTPDPGQIVDTCCSSYVWSSCPGAICGPLEWWVEALVWSGHVALQRHTDVEFRGGLCTTMDGLRGHLLQNLRRMQSPSSSFRQKQLEINQFSRRPRAPSMALQQGFLAAIGSSKSRCSGVNLEQ